MDCDNFVQDIEALDNLDETGDAVYRILEYFDELCWAGKFEEIGQILDQVDCQKFTSFALVGFLSASFPAKNELGEARKRFVQRVESHFLATQGERTEALMHGLR